ncbi:hypothetical protein [Flavobacterium sp.]|uniref:hypothetical protein n=1 Tax=Flavobacterium sp. TaxID=239 RepID=UPI0037513138
MKKIFNFFKIITPLKLIIMAITFILIGKIIENFSSDFAMFFQLSAFVLFIYAMIKHFNSK